MTTGITSGPMPYMVVVGSLPRVPHQHHGKRGERGGNDDARAIDAPRRRAPAEDPS